MDVLFLDGPWCWCHERCSATRWRGSRLECPSLGAQHKDFRRHLSYEESVASSSAPRAMRLVFAFAFMSRLTHFALGLSVLHAFCVSRSSVMFSFARLVSH